MENIKHTDTVLLTYRGIEPKRLTKLNAARKALLRELLFKPEDIL